MAQKSVLNMLTTVMFIKCGYVYENMMVNLKPSNIKLKNRMISIVKEITGCSDEIAVKKLENSNWNIADASQLR